MFRIARFVCMIFVICFTSPYGHTFPEEEKEDIGSLFVDIQNWATMIENYISQLASDGIKKDHTQSYLDKATYKFENKDGNAIVKLVKEKLGDYFKEKKHAANRLATRVRQLYDDFLVSNATRDIRRLEDFSHDIYLDSDIQGRLPPNMKFNPYFKQRISLDKTVLKISDEVPRGDQATVDTVMYTYGLEETMRENHDRDNLLRWQYFGSTAGIIRIFPGREWSINFAGFYNDYDPRSRPWYIAATSGPKDVVIVLDCSLSMKGEKFEIAKAVAKAVINTLTKQDYVNVVCARASHWDEVGKWHFFDTKVLSCQASRMVPATSAHRKDLVEKIEKLAAAGTSELEQGFDMAFSLLRSKTRTGCQSIIVFATDGKDTDGEDVRCGPGYYTRSGYVPGPICKYNWTKVWNEIDENYKYVSTKTRIFSYLIKEDAEEFPGKIACEHHGSMKKLMSGDNIISQMSNYFDFLSANAKTRRGIWTSPYIDAFGLGMMVSYAVPIVSKTLDKTIGVVGIDCTLGEIENFLTKHQWASVYSFLVSQQGEAIFHPRLKASTKLKDDPIFIPISNLEQSVDSTEFSFVEKEMREGRTGSHRVEKSRLGMPRTYYYASLEDSEFSFAYSLADTDMVFRRSEEPNISHERSAHDLSYFNLLKEYNSSEGRREFPGVFKFLDVRENESKYPGLRITYNFSTIFLAPRAHCDPTQYIYNDNLTEKTIAAHKWINSFEEDLGCDHADRHQLYDKGIRADVLITKPIEQIWANREFESLSQIKWTNVGLRSGVFRTFPGHRSTRTYDPTKRPWYRRTSAEPSKTSISTPYMDAAGVGKINTISQAVFEGMMARTDEFCAQYRNQSDGQTGLLPGGCRCNLDKECIIGVCYLSVAEGPNKHHRRCATERVEAVTGLDILYDDFQNKTMDLMKSDSQKSCGQKYNCPDGEPGCQTRCYLFDTQAFLVMDPDFLLASNLDESKYERVTLGKKEGEVMKDLIYTHKFVRRKETIDFQGTCHISPEFPKVTLEGQPTNPEEKDDYYRKRGPIPMFSNEYGCIQDVVGYTVDDKNLGDSGIIVGNVSGPCMSGFYYVIALPRTNLYLLVIENWKPYRETLFYNFNCHIARSVVNSGAYRIINGTCAHEDSEQITLAEKDGCPDLRDLKLDCRYQTANVFSSSIITIVITFVSLMTVIM